MKEIKLSTEVSITPSEWKISHHSKIMTIGSCFAEVLGTQLGGYKFEVLNNPLGTVFNPLAISKILDAALEEKAPNPALYLQNQDQIWLHHDFHSSQWSQDKNELEASLTDKLANIKQFLKQADVLVITFGTAYAYRHRQTNQIIGNCHKLPGEKFVKELLHPDQISIAWEQLIQKLQTFKRDLRIVMTVSPVRHTRDTLPLNQVSKSTLRLVCHKLSEKYKQVEYFPSYEIMIDELRDYRFYEEDMIHPNKIAEQYIFNGFEAAFIDTEMQAFMKEWDAVKQTIHHRPLHGFTKSQLKLLKSLWSKLNALSRNMDVSAELEEIEKRIREFPVS
ncbi:GSCFA domain-containing protein [Dyadobacter pollutisoli]|uniref:GSCFA domain-containing protein n=1 Tax=Dyadobacter pollutisoli TaxID=2910158 RepID=A0A9E8N8F1_9BACT|nr:GSCFA domain-containing protein [Dyadobacter pollutisoli]WAC09822.1 GSCFA domain-containing protein [Dyadobacter pollutisoli]